MTDIDMLESDVDYLKDEIAKLQIDHQRMLKVVKNLIENNVTTIPLPEEFIDVPK